MHTTPVLVIRRSRCLVRKGPIYRSARETTFAAASRGGGSKNGHRLGRWERESRVESIRGPYIGSHPAGQLGKAEKSSLRRAADGLHPAGHSTIGGEGGDIVGASVERIAQATRVPARSWMIIEWPTISEAGRPVGMPVMTPDAIPSASEEYTMVRQGSEPTTGE